MNQLSKVPAFGFESFKCFAKPHLPEQIKSALPLSNLINDSKWIEGTAKKVKASVVKQNTLKALSYIPGISFGIGIYHLHAARTNKQFSAYFIFRGVLELLGLSFLLLLPDLIMKCHRDQKAQKELISKVTFVESYEDHISKLVQERLKASVITKVEPEPQPVEQAAPPENIPEEKLDPLAIMHSFFSEIKRFDKLSLEQIQNLAAKLKEAMQADGQATDKGELNLVIHEHLGVYFKSEDYKKNAGWQAFQELASEQGGLAAVGTAYNYYLAKTENHAKELFYAYFFGKDFMQDFEKFSAVYSEAVKKMFSPKSEKELQFYCLLDMVGNYCNNFKAISQLHAAVKQEADLISTEFNDVFQATLQKYLTSSWFEMRCEMIIQDMALDVEEGEWELKAFTDATRNLIQDLALLQTMPPTQDTFNALALQAFKKYGDAVLVALPKNCALLKLLDKTGKFSMEVQKYFDTGLVSEKLFGVVHNTVNHFWFFQKEVVQGMIPGLFKGTFEKAAHNSEKFKQSHVTLQEILNKFSELPVMFKTYDKEAIDQEFAL